MTLINKQSLLNGFTHVSLNPLKNKHSPLHGNAQLQSGILSCTGSNFGKLIAWKGSCFLLSTVLVWHLANGVDCCGCLCFTELLCHKI